jgi:3-oxoacyl-[acyl-carrier protein] reductase
MELNKQLVLITGASRGLGEALARTFVDQGSKVIINYHQSETKAVELAQELGDNALAIGADVRIKADMERLVQTAENHFNLKVSTLVNNALIDYRFDPAKNKNHETIQWTDYLRQLEGSVEGALNCLQAVSSSMKTLKFGRIINIGTNLFHNPVVPYHDYTTAKSALLGFTRNMAQELGQYNITVNMVSGGLLFKTDASSATSDEVFDIIKANTPMGKVTTPQELADSVLFFASSWSRAVTGQNLIVDGGMNKS